MTPINVLLYTAGFDTGGQGYRIKAAFDKYYPDEFLVRSMHTTETYFEYPADITYRANEAPAIFAAADVIHARNGIEGLKRLCPDALDPDGPTGLVVHWHGTRFRDQHEALHAEVSQTAPAIQLVSTLDLLLLEPDLRWLPSPIDLVQFSVLRNQGMGAMRKPGTIRVVHAPTNRAVKSTAEVIKAIEGLSRRLPIELDLLERKPWSYVLERKAKGDIYIDQLDLGYGNNALEAWALGVPVIAGVSDPRVATLMLGTFGLGHLPFFEATKDDLDAKLEELATDEALRAHWGLIGLDYVTRFHNDRLVADRLAAIYREALELKRGRSSDG